MWFWWGGNVVSCISASWMNMPICLHTGKQLAFVFFAYCKNKIPANLLENLNKMFFYFIFPFLTRKKNTAHCRAHSIMLVTQKLSSSSRPWSIRRQLWGRIETLVSLTTSQSIVADYWLVKLARVSVLLLWLCTGFSHIKTTVSTGYRLKNQ